MGMKQKEWGVEERKHAVGAKGDQIRAGLQTKRIRTAAYSVVNANFRKFEGIFRHGSDVALLQDAHEDEAKRTGS